ncbi:class I SAM-dependent methyltransferase [Acinetobacter cumulans]|nr:class I SAM-dependent methyltransferase [Acinetobacter cumulans]
MDLKSKFTKIYEDGVWGGEGERFYSGSGSHNNEIVEKYIISVNNFLNDLIVEKTVVDLGCGDFNIGSKLFRNTKKYIACDIVDSLIDYNSIKFSHQNLIFKKINIVEDDLPAGNIVFIRQVLQHLSNEDILKVVKKLYKYKYLVITEHLPKFIFKPNKDYFSGPSIRLERNSGVVLDEKPFNLIYKNKYKICEVEENEGVIVTSVYEL